MAVTHGVRRIKNRDKSSATRARLVLREPKTSKSRRLLALTPEIMAQLRLDRARQAQVKISELRHSGASLLLAQGTPLHVVSEILGHASIVITRDVYGYLIDGDRRSAAVLMSQALFGG